MQAKAHTCQPKEKFPRDKMVARGAKRGVVRKGGPGVHHRKFSKTCIANGVI